MSSRSCSVKAKAIASVLCFCTYWYYAYALRVHIRPLLRPANPCNDRRSIREIVWSPALLRNTQPAFPSLSSDDTPNTVIGAAISQRISNTALLSLFLLISPIPNTQSTSYYSMSTGDAVPGMHCLAT